MTFYFFIKTLHIISSAILFGTGLGIAFFMFRSRFANDVHEKFYAVRNTVLADYIFTVPAVIVQPVTGLILIHMMGYKGNEYWLVLTYLIYVLAGVCWLPVVWIQIQLKKILAGCVATGQPPSARYRRLFKIWFLLGWPAFIGLIVVFFLMVTKPS